MIPRFVLNRADRYLTSDTILGVATCQVDYVLDAGAICQLVHRGYHRRPQSAVLYSYYGGRTCNFDPVRFCASVKCY